MGDGPSDRACGDDRRLTTTVEGLASTWKPERGVEGGRGGQEEEPGVVGRGKKTRLASKQSSARQFDRGVSLQIIASDRKKRTISAIVAFPQPVDALFPRCFRTGQTGLGDACGLFRRQQTPSCMEMEFSRNFYLISNTLLLSFKDKFIFVSPHAKIKSWGQDCRRDEAPQTVAGAGGRVACHPPLSTPQ